jgi:hypothetical protein
VSSDGPLTVRLLGPLPVALSRLVSQPAGTVVVVVVVGGIGDMA